MQAAESRPSGVGPSRGRRSKFHCGGAQRASRGIDGPIDQSDGSVARWRALLGWGSPRELVRPGPGASRRVRAPRGRGRLGFRPKPVHRVAMRIYTYIRVGPGERGPRREARTTRRSPRATFRARRPSRVAGRSGTANRLGLGPYAAEVRRLPRATGGTVE